MSASLNSVAINSTNSASYLTSDRTELAPLCSTHQDTKGLRIVAVCLTVFTAVVSIALMTQLRHGDYQVVPHGTVVSDSQECSEAGVAVMKKGGSAVDAVIATLFCLGVVLPHLVGVGGGGFLMVYDQRQQKVVGCFDFQAAVSIHSSIGVPGLVAGLDEAHKTFGQLPWSDLLSAAILLAEDGFTPSPSLLSALPLTNNKQDLVDLLRTGRNPRLRDTLQSIALNGSHEFYNGSLSNQMTDNHLVSVEDLAAYRVMVDTCEEHTLGPYQLAVAGPGSGGPVLYQLLHKINQSMGDTAPVLSVALNLKETVVVSRLYNSGVNVVALDHNDIYVSAVSGLGSVLGSLELTPGGYIMNNFNVFSTVHASENDRMATLASPIVVTQRGMACGNRFITGANDVRDAAQLLLEVLQSAASGELGSNITMQGVSDSPRARVTNTQVMLEKNRQPQLDAQQLILLAAWNYTMGNSSEPYPSLNIIHKLGDDVTPVADSRGGGSPVSF